MGLPKSHHDSPWPTREKIPGYTSGLLDVIILSWSMHKWHPCHFNRSDTPYPGIQFSLKQQVIQKCLSAGRSSNHRNLINQVVKRNKTQLQQFYGIIQIHWQVKHLSKGDNQWPQKNYAFHQCPSMVGLDLYTFSATIHHYHAVLRD